MSTKKYLEDCIIQYGDREYTYEDMYKLIRAHSTLLDRLNPRKMLLMTFYAFDIKSGIMNAPKKKHWHILRDREYEQFDQIDVDGHRNCD